MALITSGCVPAVQVTISGAGHNDLLMCGEKQYFDAVAAFIAGLAPLSAGAGHPKTWTILEQDGPNHLGF